jgi:hypothetical protein
MPKHLSILNILPSITIGFFFTKHQSKSSQNHHVGIALLPRLLFFLMVFFFFWGSPSEENLPKNF